MRFTIEINNTNGSHSTLEVIQQFSPSVGWIWNWEEIAPKVLADDDIDRVEEAIIDILGDPNDMTPSTITGRIKHYKQNDKKIDRLVEDINNIIDQYFK